MKKSLIGWLFAFLAVGAIKTGLKNPFGAILIPIFFICYLIWFISGMPGLK
tara:strand:- start:149 stop:301 length:153 start_codon:yes stop_codon:yes gene_type:complete